MPCDNMFTQYSLVQHSVSIGGSRAHTEEVSVDASGVIVHVVQLRAGLVPASDHGAHAQAVPSVLIPVAESEA